MIEVWDDLAAIQHRMDALIREFMGPRARLSYPALPLFVRRPFLPATDVFTRGDDMIVRMELPGIDPEKDIKVVLEEDVLVIRGERRRTEEIAEEDYVRKEADYGTFERRIPVPEGFDEKRIVAEYTDGVLEVKLLEAAKIETPTKGKVIPVKPVRSEKAVKAA